MKCADYPLLRREGRPSATGVLAIALFAAVVLAGLRQAGAEAASKPEPESETTPIASITNRPVPGAPLPVVEERQPGQSLGSSRAWYMMGQYNTGPLLIGLPQQLGKVIARSRPDDPVWTGVEGGAQAELEIEVIGDSTGDVFVGFFEDDRWQTEPVQARALPGAGRHLVRDVPPGRYRIGAMIGTPLKPVALGVHRSWPAPVEIKPGKTTAVRLRVSEQFYRHALHDDYHSCGPGFCGVEEGRHPDNLLQGKVTGPDGSPIPYAVVQIRQKRTGSGIATPDVGTDEHGQYSYDQMEWPYKVGVLWQEPLPALLAFRWQYKGLNRYLEGPQTINFQLDGFTHGAAGLAGRATDQHGRPVQEFHLDIRTKTDWSDKSVEYIRSAGYRIPILSADGSFRITSLPEGEFIVWCIPFDVRLYAWPESQNVTLEAAKTREVTITMVKKSILYGRVLFKDGKPAFFSKPPWPGARISVTYCDPNDHWMSGTGADVDRDGYFALPLTDEEVALLKSGERKVFMSCPIPARQQVSRRIGEFPHEQLSADRGKAGAVQISPVAP